MTEIGHGKNGNFIIVITIKIGGENAGEDVFDVQHVVRIVVVGDRIILKGEGRVWKDEDVHSEEKEMYVDLDVFLAADSLAVAIVNAPPFLEWFRTNTADIMC